jgi:hypothetical protein
VLLQAGYDAIDDLGRIVEAGVEQNERECSSGGVGVAHAPVHPHGSDGRQRTPVASMSDFRANEQRTMLSRHRFDVPSTVVELS